MMVQEAGEKTIAYLNFEAVRSGSSAIISALVCLASSRGLLQM